MLKATVLSGVAKAKSALQDLALDATLISRVASAHVPGQAVSYTTTERAIKLVLTKYTVKEIDNERILAGDYQGIVFPESDPTVMDIVVNDVITDGTYKWRVVREDKVRAGSSVALFVLQLRTTLP